MTQTLGGLQAQTHADKSTQDARLARLANCVKQQEAHSQHLANTLSELEQFAHKGLLDTLDAKMKTNNDKLRNELNEVNAVTRQYTQQLSQRMNKANEVLLHHKERLAQLDACLRKLAGLLKETQGDLDNVKGPLATLATNLHEENVAILQEIERSQVRDTKHYVNHTLSLTRLPCRMAHATSCWTTRIYWRERRAPRCSCHCRPGRHHRHQAARATPC